MKVLALDFGTKRVGLASTDETGRFALPRGVFSNDEALLQKVLEFKNTNAIDKVVIGESNNFKGFPNPIMEEVLMFKKKLEEAGVAVILHPETFTTQEAIRLQGENEFTDASAAALILKNFLDSIYTKGDDL